MTMLVPREYSGSLFQDALPAASDPSTCPDRPKKHEFRVVGIGVGVIQAERLRDKRTLAISWDPETQARGASGKNMPVEAFVASLAEGAVIHIKGDRVRPGHNVMARTMRLEPNV
jgi:hypothetical protein